MKELLSEDRFSFLSDKDKQFIIAFDEEIGKLGYDFGGNIGSGYCWGKYMVIYSKTGAKNKEVIARIYIRDSGIVLRLFFSDIDRHRRYIEDSPDYLKGVFTGKHGDCDHCKNDKDGKCKFRKSYTIDGKLYDKCNGLVFEFWEPSTERLPGYMGVLREFYGPKRAGAGV